MRTYRILKLPQNVPRKKKTKLIFFLSDTYSNTKKICVKHREGI